MIQQQRLADIGDWLKVNGEAIYGSDSLREIQLTPPAETYFTRKGDCVYVLSCQWPENPLIIKGRLPVEGVSFLGLKKNIQWEQRGAELMIRPPRVTPATIPCQHAYVFKNPAPHDGSIVLGRLGSNRLERISGKINPGRLPQ